MLTLMSLFWFRRKHIPDTPQDCKLENELAGTFRPPFAVLIQNCHNINTFTTPIHAKSEELSNDGNSPMIRFLQVVDCMSEKFVHKGFLTFKLFKL